MKNVIGLVVSHIYVFALIFSAKLIKTKNKEINRKYIHIFLSNWWIIAMIFFDNPIWASIGPASFIIINYLSYKKNIFSIMEREVQDGLGTVFYATGLLFLVILTFGILNNPQIGLVSMLVMAYGDGLAAIVGTTIKSKEFNIGKTKKTLAGSITMFIVTLIILSTFFIISGINYWILKAIILSIIITIVEAISIKGTDNITVPILTSILLICVLNVF